jgi:hypothetical protein
MSTIFLSCSNYQVVSEVRVNMYHLHNPKTNDVEIVITKDSLEIGKFYNIKTIKRIDTENIK